MLTNKKNKIENQDEEIHEAIASYHDIAGALDLLKQSKISDYIKNKAKEFIDKNKRNYYIVQNFIRNLDIINQQRKIDALNYAIFCNKFYVMEIILSSIEEITLKDALDNLKLLAKHGFAHVPEIKVIEKAVKILLKQNFKQEDLVAILTTSVLNCNTEIVTIILKEYKISSLDRGRVLQLISESKDRNKNVYINNAEDRANTIRNVRFLLEQGIEQEDKIKALNSAASCGDIKVVMMILVASEISSKDIDMLSKSLSKYSTIKKIEALGFALKIMGDSTLKEENIKLFLKLSITQEDQNRTLITIVDDYENFDYRKPASRIDIMATAPGFDFRSELVRALIVYGNPTLEAQNNALEKIATSTTLTAVIKDIIVILLKKGNNISIESKCNALTSLLNRNSNDIVHCIEFLLKSGIDSKNQYKILIEALSKEIINNVNCILKNCQIADEDLIEALKFHLKKPNALTKSVLNAFKLTNEDKLFAYISATDDQYQPEFKFIRNVSKLASSQDKYNSCYKYIELILLEKTELKKFFESEKETILKSLQTNDFFVKCVKILTSSAAEKGKISEIKQMIIKLNNKPLQLLQNVSSVASPMNISIS